MENQPTQSGGQIHAVVSDALLKDYLILWALLGVQVAAGRSAPSTPMGDLNDFMSATLGLIFCITGFLGWAREQNTPLTGAQRPV